MTTPLKGAVPRLLLYIMSVVAVLVVLVVAAADATSAREAVDACGVAGGAGRACCHYRGVMRGATCVCDVSRHGPRVGAPCGRFCHLRMDACGVCGGLGTSCCTRGLVKDHVTGMCGPRRMDLYVYEAPYNPDGYPRDVIAVAGRHPAAGLFETRAFPGPLLAAVEGEQVEVTVHNLLRDRVTTMHFHGIHMRNNAWMDGTIGVTECGIQPGDSRTYAFNATQAGTFWYHSHVSGQYTDGLQGPFILHPANRETDAVAVEFDYELDYTIMLQEWFHDSYVDLVTNLHGPWGSFSSYEPQYPWPPVGILMNGKGRFDCSRIEECETNTSPMASRKNDSSFCHLLRRSYVHGKCDSNHLAHNADHFICPTGSWIRIRLTTSGSNIPIRFWIDRHDMIIVARDGIPILPVERRFITLPVGQRLDVMVRCRAADAGAAYQIFAAANANFFPEPERYDSKHYNELFTYAYLQYASPVPTDQSPFLPLSSSFIQPEIDCLHDEIQLDSTSLFDDYDILQEYTYQPQDASKVAPAASRRIVLRSSVSWNEDEGSALEWWTTNNVSFVPPETPLLHQYWLGGERIPGRRPSPRVTPTSANVSFETLIIDVAYGEVVEIVLISYSGQQHPWHIHGNSVYFLGANVVSSDANSDYSTIEQRLNNFEYSGQFGRLSDSVAATMGDSWTVPAFGYVVLRLVGDNPGPWIFHCHVDWHMSTGMALIVDVGFHQGYPGLLPPPPSFTTCGAGNRRASGKTAVPSASNDTKWQVATLAFACLWITTLAIAGFAFKHKQQIGAKYLSVDTDDASAVTSL